MNQKARIYTPLFLGYLICAGNSLGAYAEVTWSAHALISHNRNDTGNFLSSKDHKELPHSVDIRGNSGAAGGPILDRLLLKLEQYRSSTPIGPGPSPAWDPQVTVLFPPKRGLYRGDNITVRGRVSEAEASSIEIFVDGGAEQVSGVVSDGGEWIAELVPLADRENIEVTVEVRSSGGNAWESVVSELQREWTEFIPQHLAFDTANRRLFIASRSNLFQEYRLGNGESRWIMPEPTELERFFEFDYFPASGELTRGMQATNGDCLVRAYNVETAADRELMKLSRIAPSTHCGRNDITLEPSFLGDMLYIVDGENGQIHSLDASGSLLSTLDIDLNTEGHFDGGLGLSADSESSEFLAFAQLMQETQTGWWEFQATASRINLENGQVHSVFESEPENWRGQRLAFAGLLDRNLYYSVDSELRSLNLDSFTAERVDKKGFVALGISDLEADPDAGVIYTLDLTGTISQLDLALNRATPIHTVDPYFYNGPRLSQVGGEDEYIYAYLYAERPDFAPIDIWYVSWSNLFQLNLSDLTLKQVFATESEVGSIGGSVVNNDFSIVFAYIDDLRVLAWFSHGTGEITPIELDYDLIGSMREFAIEREGKYLAIRAYHGLFDINLETLEIGRQLLIEGDTVPQVRYMVRAPGLEGEIYVVDEREPKVYRVDFGAQELREVSGSEVGSGPLPTKFGPISLSNDGLTAWFVLSKDAPLARMDMNSGDRQVVLDAENNLGINFDHIYQVTDVESLDALYVLARNFDGTSLYHLDPITGARVELPMSQVGE